MPGGRPSKLTPEIAKRIIDLVRAGNFAEAAAGAAGITRQTLHNWLRRGAEEGEGPFFDFAQELEIAAGEAEAKDVLSLVKAGGKDWRAIAWRLERRCARWRRPDPSEPTEERPSAEEKAAKIRSLIKAMRESVPTSPPSSDTASSG